MWSSQKEKKKTISLVLLRRVSWTGVSLRMLTFDFLVLLVPASKLLTFGRGDVGVVRTVHDGGDHTLRERGGGP